MDANLEPAQKDCARTRVGRASALERNMETKWKMKGEKKSTQESGGECIAL